MHGVGYLLFALIKNGRNRLRSAYFRVGPVLPRQPNAYSSSSSVLLNDLLLKRSEPLRRTWQAALTDSRAFPIS